MSPISMRGVSMNNRRDNDIYSPVIVIHRNKTVPFDNNLIPALHSIKLLISLSLRGALHVLE